MCKIKQTSGPSNGTTEAGGDRRRDAKPVPEGDFQGMLVHQVVEKGNADNAIGAFEYLWQLSKTGTEKEKKEALQALRTAAQTPSSNPNYTFNALVKLAMPALGSEANKQGLEKGSVRRGVHDRFKTLERLLKSEYRGRVNPVSDDMDLRTGKEEIRGREREIPSLKIGQFHKTLEKKGVADIAIAWFEELESLYSDPNSHITAKKRINIQTNAVKFLDGLNSRSILVLNKLFERTTSETRIDFFNLLRIDRLLADAAVMGFNERLKDLCELFPDASLKGLSFAAHLDHSSVDMELFKQLRNLFPGASLKDLSKVYKKVEVGRLKELHKLFPDASLEDLSFAAHPDHSSVDMELFKQLRNLFPGASLKDLSEVHKKVEVGRLKVLHKLFPDASLKDLSKVRKGVDVEWLKDLYEQFPRASLEDLSFVALERDDDQLQWFKEKKGNSDQKSLREFFMETIHDDDFYGAKIKDLYELFPDASLKNLSNYAFRSDIEKLKELKNLFPDQSFRPLFLIQSLYELNKRFARLKTLYTSFPGESLVVLKHCSKFEGEKLKQFNELKEQFPDASASDLSSLVGNEHIEHIENFNKLKEQFPDASFKDLSFVAIQFENGDPDLVWVTEEKVNSPQKSLRDLFAVPQYDDSESLERFKVLNELFGTASLEDLCDSVRELDAWGMERLEELKTLFDTASLKDLTKVALQLNAQGMERLKVLKTQFPHKPLEYLSNRACRLA